MDSAATPDGDLQEFLTVAGNREALEIVLRAEENVLLLLLEIAEEGTATYQAAWMRLMSLRAWAEGVLRAALPVAWWRGLEAMLAAV